MVAFGIVQPAFFNHHIDPVVAFTIAELCNPGFQINATHRHGNGINQAVATKDMLQAWLPNQFVVFAMANHPARLHQANAIGQFQQVGNVMTNDQDWYFERLVNLQ